MPTPPLPPVPAPAPTDAGEDLSASIAALSTALQERDGYTRSHCDRVSHLATLLGRHVGLDAAALSDLALAARFHDVGKIGIPDSVLLKPDRLEPEEMAIMRSHAERGERVFLATGREDAPRVARLIRQHHEAWDGSGYPDGLRGAEIALGARILAVADSYDAMTTTRPYRAPIPHGRVMDILRSEAGTRLDPLLVAAFEELVADGHLDTAETAAG